MQAPPYHTNYLQQPFSPVYGSMPSFHPRTYSDTMTDMATFYHSNVSSGSVTAPVYHTSAALPSYAKCTLPATSSFHFQGFFQTSCCTEGYNNGSTVNGVFDAGADFHTLTCSERSNVCSDRVVYNNVVGRTGDKEQAGDCDVGDGEDQVGGLERAVDDSNYAAFSNKIMYVQPQSYPHQTLQSLDLPLSSEHRSGKQHELNTQADLKPFHDYGASPSGNASVQHGDLLQRHNNDHADLSQSPKEELPDRHPQSPSKGSSGERNEKTSTSPDAEDNTTMTGTSPPRQKAENEADSGRDSNQVKPALSYIALIAKSILESPHRRLNLGSIYGWIEHNFPYYKHRGQGWRNSVRHNLSLNDCFIKAGRCEDGKGNYWTIHPANLHDFLHGDFRQRRRSRRRVRKNSELGLHSHAYPGSSQIPAETVAPAQMTFPPPAAANLSSVYYTESEWRTYHLDEAVHRQATGTSLYRWYHPCTTYPYATAPSPATSDMYNWGGCGRGDGNEGFYPAMAADLQ